MFSVLSTTHPSPLLWVSSFSLKGLFKCFLTRSEGLRTGGVTFVQTVKPTFANNVCVLGLKIDFIWFVPVPAHQSRFASSRFSQSRPHPGVFIVNKRNKMWCRVCDVCLYATGRAAFHFRETVTVPIFLNWTFRSIKKKKKTELQGFIYPDI